MNTIGPTLEDYTRPFQFRTELYQFRHPKPRVQNVTAFRDDKYYDYILPNVALVDIESNLRGNDRPLSKLPQTRYNPIENHSLPIVSANVKEDTNKIIREKQNQYKNLAGTKFMPWGGGNGNVINTVSLEDSGRY